MVELIVFADDTPESKVAQDLIPYFEAVIEEVARHVPEKGYGYRNSEWLIYFLEQTKNLAESYWYNPENVGEALDIGAMAAFAWSHQTDVWSIENGGVRSK